MNVYLAVGLIITTVAWLLNKLAYNQERKSLVWSNKMRNQLIDENEDLESDILDKDAEIKALNERLDKGTVAMKSAEQIAGMASKYIDQLEALVEERTLERDISTESLEACEKQLEDARNGCKRLNERFSLKRMQQEQAKWLASNFSDSLSTELQLMKLQEEVGELSKALYNQRTKAGRNFKFHVADNDVTDAVADIAITLSGLSSTLNILLEDVVDSTWQKVKQRTYAAGVKKEGIVGRREPNTMSVSSGAAKPYLNLLKQPVRHEVERPSTISYHKPTQEKPALKVLLEDGTIRDATADEQHLYKRARFATAFGVGRHPKASNIFDVPKRGMTAQDVLKALGLEVV